jgi:hypothetical protein
MKRSSVFSNRTMCTIGALAIVLASCGMSQEKRIAKHIGILKDKKASAKRRRSAARALGEIGKPAMPALIDMMNPECRHAFSDLGYAFGRMGPGCIPSLTDALQHQEWFVRYTCALVLASWGPEAAKAVPSLQRLVENRGEKTSVRVACAFALGEIGEAAKPAVPALLAATQENKPPLWDQAIKSLKVIDRTALELIPLQENTTGGLISKYKRFSEWDHRQILVQIGRFEFARFDLNRDWKLTREETSGTSLAESPSPWPGPFLTFEQAGQSAADQFLAGYMAGCKASQPDLDDETIEKMCNRDTTRKGLALLMRNSLRSCDRDRDGVLSDKEYALWVQKAEYSEAIVPMALFGYLPGAGEPDK